MRFRFFQLALLLVVVLAQSGCATTKATVEDPNNGLEPSESHEDSSHGWGTNIQGGAD